MSLPRFIHLTNLLSAKNWARDSMQRERLQSVYKQRNEEFYWGMRSRLLQSRAKQVEQRIGMLLFLLPRSEKHLLEVISGDVQGMKY